MSDFIIKLCFIDRYLSEYLFTLAEEKFENEINHSNLCVYFPAENGWEDDLLNIQTAYLEFIRLVFS